MTDDLHSIVRRVESLHAERDALGEDIASVFRDAKKAKLDLPALRLAIAERRRRAKNPGAYESLKGLAAEYLDALDNGVVIGHARAPARGHTQPDRAATSSAPAGCGGEGDPAAADSIPPSAAGAAGHEDVLAADPSPPVAPPAPCADSPTPAADTVELGGPGSAMQPASANATAAREGQDSAGTDDDMPPIPAANRWGSPENRAARGRA